MTGTTPIKCTKCEHEWDTSSTNKMVTCPSCIRKTPNPLYKD